MNTVFIGMKELRANLSKISEGESDTRYIVLKNNKPVLEINLIDEEDYDYVRLSKDLDEAEKDLRNGDVLAHEDVMKLYG